MKNTQTQNKKSNGRKNGKKSQSSISTQNKVIDLPQVQDNLQIDTENKQINSLNSQNVHMPSSLSNAMNFNQFSLLGNLNNFGQLNSQYQSILHSVPFLLQNPYMSLSQSSQFSPIPNAFNQIQQMNPILHQNVPIKQEIASQIKKEVQQKQTNSNAPDIQKDNMTEQKVHSQQDIKKKNYFISSYAVFTKAHYHKVKLENPGFNHIEIAKFIGQKWKDLSKEERQIYQDQAQAIKNQDNLEQGQAGLKKGKRQCQSKKSPDQNKKIGKVTPYIAFHKEKYSQLRREKADITVVEAAKAIALLWKELTQEQKNYYKQAAEQQTKLNQEHLQLKGQSQISIASKGQKKKQQKYEAESVDKLQESAFGEINEIFRK
ncbi:UNKNOWN [Stylonychia lemnae]|uniref:HMG box domain-containing protein n=1 Tax=Stylonychia lemnae TaxID=5949 RepID=A0A078AD95_STYLE|nr:UNKNOWN [Stylonychia lemnae]|eukprot:CDW80210.1 UNKNOWN [Stylonychia lemnae]